MLAITNIAYRKEQAASPGKSGPNEIWLPRCNTFRRSLGWAEPEVYFRIVHISLQDRYGGPAATYREQTVEIALGPKGAFENGNIGTLMRAQDAPGGRAA